MLAKKQEEILNLFRKNVFLKATIREISKIMKKAYPKTYEAVKEMEKQGIIKINKIGNSSVCEINLTDKTISILGYLDEQEAHLNNIPNMQKILNFEEFLDDIILVTGSYAGKKAGKNSDIDLVIITKEKAFNKQKLIENLTSLIIPEIHVIVLTNEDFIKMLLDKEENYGKEIFKNRLIFRNSNRYYYDLKEAIKNGFRG